MTNDIPKNWAFDENTRFKIEFQLRNILPGNDFRIRIVNRCRSKEIYGYIIFTDDGRRAFGLMDGKRKELNSMKDWILSCCISEPFAHRVYFSFFQFSLNPNKEEFHIKYSVPKNARFLGDVFENYFRKTKFDKKEKVEREELGEYADFHSPQLINDF
ncbi:hypothetical protein KR084_011491, partial [Drosophila pseudotakahashii]